MKKFVIAAILSAGVAAPAMAQQVPFDGLRVEGIVGYDNVSADGEDADGATYGAAVGYDFGRGPAVFGVEAEITESSAEECIRGFAMAGDQLCAEAGRDIYVGGRVGGRVSPNALLYAKAGYTNAKFDLAYDDGIAGGGGDFTLDDEYDGFRVGAGAEYAIGPNSYAKAEYRYSSYEDDFERHQVVAGFGFRF